ncbi:hypothetical protein DFS34DRAFT_648412 [Phlyctochytrium arcticum]|nr:hypothetical protein DFS34DRAFT_648412 [Phlyctochytrium arcticum]
MLDFMEYCLRRYYRSLDWKEDYQYSSLVMECRRLLDFSVPQGVSITLGKTVSPELKSAYTLGIPNIRSVGFLFTSMPLDLPPMHLRDENGLVPLAPVAPQGPTDIKLLGGASALADMEGLSTNSITPAAVAARKKQSYLLYGRLFEDLRLEALYSRAISDKTILVASGVNSWQRRPQNPDTSINAQLLHATPTFSSELSYTTDDHVFGLSGLYRFGGTNWSAGSELYYTAKEKSGGLSLGARYRSPSRPDGPSQPVTVLTFLSNPMMGHISATYTTTVRRNLTMATRYHFNLYSYEADLALGVEYAPADKEQLVKARISLSEGLAVKLEGQYKRALFSIGLMTQFVYNPRRSIGIELQIF